MISTDWLSFKVQKLKLQSKSVNWSCWALGWPAFQTCKKLCSAADRQQKEKKCREGHRNRMIVRERRRKWMIDTSCKLGVHVTKLSFLCVSGHFRYDCTKVHAKLHSPTTLTYTVLLSCSDFRLCSESENRRVKFVNKRRIRALPVFVQTLSFDEMKPF